MTPELEEGYRSLLEACGRLSGPNKIYVHNPRLAGVSGMSRCWIPIGRTASITALRAAGYRMLVSGEVTSDW